MILGVEMDTTADEHEFLRPREVAELLRVSERQVRRMRECQILTPYVSCHRPRYSRSEVLDVAEHLGRSGLPR